MPEIAFSVVMFVRYKERHCGFRGEACDYCGWDGSEEVHMCMRYRDGPEKACPQLASKETGKYVFRCHQCVKEFKG